MLDEAGDRLSPSHANKKGRRYRYSRTIHPKWRLPAEGLERAVLDGVHNLLTDRYQLTRALYGEGITLQAGNLAEHLQSARALGEDFKGAPVSEQRVMLPALVARVVIADNRIGIVVRNDALRARIGIPEEGDPQSSSADELAIDLPVAFRRRGVETKLIISGAGTALPAPDASIVALLVQAQQWSAELRSDSALSVNALAQRYRVDSGDMSRVLPLAFLAPDIVEAILDGRQPPELTAARLKRIKDLPFSWARQREVLGFA